MPRNITKLHKIIIASLISAIIALPVVYHYGRALWVPIYQKVMGKKTVNEVIEIYGPKAESRLLPYFAKAGIPYPPQQVTLLAIKDKKTLELWAGDAQSQKLIRTYAVQAASGSLGPKLVEGDSQVPEGLYQLEYLNPNSLYHLSMKLNYPNQFDLKQAKQEGRDQPGTNIFIHGKALSIGCLAMGDKAIEELFVLAAKAGIENINVAIAPIDPRAHSLDNLALEGKPWVKDLYAEITGYFQQFNKHL